MNMLSGMIAQKPENIDGFLSSTAGGDASKGSKLAPLLV